MSDVTNFSSVCVTYLLISHLCSSASSSITWCACSIKQFVVICELIGKYLEYLLWLFYSPMGKFVIRRKLFPDYSFANERQFHNTLFSTHIAQIWRCTFKTTILRSKTIRHFKTVALGFSAESVLMTMTENEVWNWVYRRYFLLSN